MIFGESQAPAIDGTSTTMKYYMSLGSLLLATVSLGMGQNTPSNAVQHHDKVSAKKVSAKRLSAKSAVSSPPPTRGSSRLASGGSKNQLSHLEQETGKIAVGKAPKRASAQEAGKSSGPRNPRMAFSATTHKNSSSLRRRGPGTGSVAMHAGR
jgi:hypothetical protein